MRDRTALKNQEKNLTIPLLKRQHKQRLNQIDQHITAFHVELAASIAADPQLARRHEIISSIAGLGPRTANQLVATMPELGSLDNKQAASLAGLAPVANQGSGKAEASSRVGAVVIVLDLAVLAGRNNRLGATLNQPLSQRLAIIALVSDKFGRRWHRLDAKLGNPAIMAFSSRTCRRTVPGRQPCGGGIRSIEPARPLASNTG